MSQDSGERTEKATPKKRQDARKRGNVLKSMEVTTAFCSMVMFALLLLIWPNFVQQASQVFLDFLSASYLIPASREMSIGVAQQVLFEAIVHVVWIVWPLFACAMAVGVAINLLQIGFLFTTESLKPKLSKISPISGFKRLFSSRALVDLLKSILKIICLGYIAYSEYKVLLVKFPSLMAADLYTSFVESMRIAFVICLKMCLVLAILAAFDYLYQWWKFEKDLKMTKQEVKDEYKQVEGDPQIKGKIRQKQRQMSAMRMMEKVPSADVVITNPTHYAVALRYKEGESNAPVVLAKGQDFMARKIRETAREHGIEIVENKPLAQALYQFCEVGDEIPSEFYQAVADILVYVYRQKHYTREGNR